MRPSNDLKREKKDRKSVSDRFGITVQACFTQIHFLLCTWKKERKKHKNYQWAFSFQFIPYFRQFLLLLLLSPAPHIFLFAVCAICISCIAVSHGYRKLLTKYIYRTTRRRKNWNRKMSVKRNTPKVLTQRHVPMKFNVLSLFVFYVLYMIECVWAWA